LNPPLLIEAGSVGNKLFGFLLGIYRESSGLQPKDLADKAGVHASFVRGIERGAQAPSLETAINLLKPIKNQKWIHWMNDGEDCDLVMMDPTTKKEVAFIFKAAKRGQHSRNSKSEIPLKERLRIACLDRAIEFSIKTGLPSRQIPELAKQFENYISSD
jgi:transcriptional regulator with XRE-family HTH domain